MTPTITAFGSILAQTDGGQTSASPLVSLLPFVLIFVAMYFLMIRPQQRRARAQRELLMSLEIGDEVITAGGIYGTITDLDDETATIEVSPGTNIRFARQAIARKLVYDEDGGYGDEDVEDEEKTEGP